jgi:hypothetical protein
MSPLLELKSQCRMEHNLGVLEAARNSQKDSTKPQIIWLAQLICTHFLYKALYLFSFLKNVFRSFKKEIGFDTIPMNVTFGSYSAVE